MKSHLIIEYEIKTLKLFSLWTLINFSRLIQ